MKGLILTLQCDFGIIALNGCFLASDMDSSLCIFFLMWLS